MSKLVHRKAAQKIRFIDSERNILSNTSVKIKLKNHQYLFGNGAFDSLPATSEDDLEKINLYHDKALPEKSFLKIEWING